MTEASKPPGWLQALAGLLALLAILGLVLLFTVFDWPYVTGGIVALLCLCWLLPWLSARVEAPSKPRRFLLFLGRIVGALLVPLLALLGIEYIWVKVGLGPAGLIAGFLIAAAFIAGACLIYLRSWLVFKSPRHPLLWSSVVTILLVAVGPLISLATANRHGGDDLPQPDLASRLDVAVVGQNRWPALPRIATTDGWDVHYWVGRANGQQVIWRGGARPRLRQGADSALYLAPDDLPQALEHADQLPNQPGHPNEIPRWMAIANRSSPRNTPTFVLLQTRNHARLAGWRARLAAPTASPRSGRRGQAFSVQELAGSQSIADLTLRLAVTSPTSASDLALAAQYRPALFFDYDEDYFLPLDVGTLIRSGTFRICRDKQPLLALCPQVHSSSDLWNGPNHLAFDTEQVAQSNHTTQIYVHVVHHHGLIYLDYWWYLPDNPTYSADGALCGAGLVIAELACTDHQSDWEGVTVVINSRRIAPLPVKVTYAAHQHRISYSWDALRQQLWRLPQTAPFRSHFVGNGRPLVFVARGTHASYPTACPSSHCDEPGTGLQENSHDGERAWIGNRDANCQTTCLAPLPTHKRGKEPALWNAYHGPWGTADCDLSVVCGSAEAPQSPGQQPRYARPWCVTRSIKLVDRQLTSRGRVAPASRPPRLRGDGGAIRAIRWIGG